MMRLTATHIEKALFLSGALALASSAFGRDAAASDGSLYDAFLNGTPSLDMRYRFEDVDQKKLADNAQASTLRTRLGFETAKFHDFSAKLEIENVSAIGDEHYNDGINNETRYPKVGDPRDTALNQAWLSYSGIDKTDIKAGQQIISLDNQRFVSPVDWRQNDQTFNGATITSAIVPDLKVFYGYVYEVNRTAGNDSPVGHAHGNVNLLNADYTGFKALSITGYDYYLNFDSTVLPSSNTTGVRATGKTPLGYGVSALYTGEYAHQTNLGNAHRAFDVNYALAEPGLAYGDFTLKESYELLGSDGLASFQTPLASPHLFNGFAGMFQTIPVKGLQDIYTTLSYAPTNVPYLQDTSFTARYDDFRADSGDTHYGSEVDLIATKQFLTHYTVGAAYANYTSDNARALQSATQDTRKLWLWVAMKY